MKRFADMNLKNTPLVKSIVHLHFVVVCVLALGLLPRASAQPPKVEINKDGVTWVQKCLADFETLKTGMTREQVQSKFCMDGGLSSPSGGRFTHPACPYFKIEVEFDFQRNPADQNRAVESKTDKVIRISKPYLETPFAD